MSTCIVVGVLAVVVLIALALKLRSNSMRAEATLRSIAAVIGSNGIGAALVRDVRFIWEGAAEADARATSLLAALEEAPDGIIILDAMGAVRYANAVARSVLNGSGERPLLKARISALGQRVAQSNEAERIEVDLFGPDRRVYALTAVPLDSASDEFGAVVLYLDDLSVKRQVDEMRVDFVANASHELKTPLGALSLLAETLAGARHEEQRSRLAKRLVSESARIATVIDDIAQLAETHSSGVEFSHVSVESCINDAVGAVEALAMETGISLERGVSANATVAGSHAQITSAIRNLLINAITYTAVKEDDGVVTFASVLDGDMVSIEVKDTGIGVPERYTDRVFERFFRVDRARSRESGGTGLGLSIVKNIAIAHGGTVYFHSVVGVGSTFGIRLPLIVQDADSQESVG